MGYYSDVAIILSKMAANALKVRLNDSSIPEKVRKESSRLLIFTNKHLTDAGSGSEAWYWDTIKWYVDAPEYFPEVDFMEKFLAELAESEYRFMRVGEEFDDLEVRGSYLNHPFDLTLSRSISLTDSA